MGLADLDVDRDLAKADQVLHGLHRDRSEEHQRVFKRGGKLLTYQGWSDQDISPLASVNFYKSMPAAVGDATVSSSMRLFMVPGMGHCGGGEGPNTFDMMVPLEQWVEKGQAPARITASHSTNGKIDRTRPLCPYPQVARYTGQEASTKRRTSPASCHDGYVATPPSTTRDPDASWGDP
jgi:feruloyl esterase